MKSYTPRCPSNYTPTVRLQAITACSRNASLFIRHRGRKKGHIKTKTHEKAELLRRTMLLSP